jgi:hypothetical protein
MAGKNDKKIKEYLTLIEAQKQSLGTKPRASWLTNGLLKYNGEAVNINTVMSVEKCVEIVSHLLKEQYFNDKAYAYLGLDPASADSGYLQDFKLRAAMLVWDNKNAKLKALEAKLKELRSEDAKTSDAISDIMSQL